MNVKNIRIERGLKCRKPVPQRRPPVNHDGHRKPTVCVAIRQQTPEEERQFEEALDIFLMELVRQNTGQ